MKKTFLKTFVMISLIGGVTITSTSCKKEGCTSETATNFDADATTDDGSCTEPEPDQPEATEPENPQPKPAGADAVFIALKTVTYTSSVIGTIETPIGLPIAFAINGTTFDEMGTVTCETKELEKQDNNAYIFLPSASDYTGVTYSGGIDWEISGGTGLPAHTKTSDGTFPSGLELSTASNGTISTSSEYTLETKAAISDADSVIFAVYGTSNSVLVTKAGTENSHTFTASEMASIGEGIGYVQVAGYRVAENETLSSGEIVFYLNETVNTSVVTFE